MECKRCIFHVPYKINKEVTSGTNIRPIKMIDGFKLNGYKVDIIEGYGEKRKNAIEEIKNNIKQGIKYDFVYSESSTMPTQLTEKNHIPKYPFLDFGFLKFCKDNLIPIGLFYRDIHWKFPQYKNSVNIVKQLVSKVFYEYDLKKYRQLIDVLYLPSNKMFKYLDIDFNGQIYDLPPGTEQIDLTFYGCKNEDASKLIKLFYVGGINEELYNLKLLFKAVKENKNLFLTLCCRENEWENNKQEYEEYLNDRINIIHKKGEELIPIARNSDIMNLYIKPTAYWEFAMPVKLFTYLSYEKPMLGVKNTSAGDFIEKNNIGWSIEYNFESINEFLKGLSREHIREKEGNLPLICENNTWKSRAKKVIEDLNNFSRNGGV